MKAGRQLILRTHASVRLQCSQHLLRYPCYSEHSLRLAYSLSPMDSSSEPKGWGSVSAKLAVLRAEYSGRQPSPDLAD